MIKTTNIALFKGIHPGLYLGRKLKRMQISQIKLANAIAAHPQTLNAIIKGKRAMNIPLSLKIESHFNWEEGLLMSLQLYYDIEKEKQYNSKKPDLSVFRAALFWDTNMASINWVKNKKAVIQRVMSRGNNSEQEAIIKHYGTKEVTEIMDAFKWFSIG